jgi:glutamate dehydrogenase
VPSFDQDKILHSLLQLIGASLRTNFFQNKDYVSVKLDSSRIDILPLPKPYVEIFVYSPRVEGVHLRGGKVARGGLRWSDRHEDFRTEVLGLMKAQNVKNAVIIPVGSKGGFVVKRPPQNPDRKAMQDEAITCYKIFISGLLDITDNIVNKKVKPPKDCVRHDCDDPYLVVAADKGTATFSDIANGIAEDYNFWLGDAFASGGSAGYDHKDMGITAKGAWESVKRHFRELGLDIQRQEFDVIGIGDMGGDVFGNGMLLSPYIRLIGAFNHLHIFCDPDPDIKKSFKERERLFNEIKGWDHYNEKILSKGGRIFSRHDKELSLTPEIMKRFDLSDKKVSPQKLMNAMLKAQTDLLWFGGIGTYIKAPNESHADVGDKANDTIRVDAHEVRARVIGEGANLGVTHAGRICMALLGVKLYADFVDNSGGVNSSDLEVNIKILLQQLMQQNEMDVKTRNKLLKSMTDDIAALVLRNNDQQAQAISVVAHEASETLQLHADLITHLEKAVNLNREIEYLPNAAAIEERARNNQGLTAPEIATLVSYTKIKLFQDLLDSHIPDDPAFQSWLINYFPAKLQKKYRDQMDSHRLKREIIATQLSNTIINRMGPAYIMDQTIKTGVAACTVARAYIIIREIFSLSNLYADIEALDNKASALSQIEALSKIATFVNYGTTWFLKNFDVESLKDENLVALGKNFQKSVQHLVKNIDNLLPNSGLLFIAERQNRLKEAGFPMDIARRVAMLPILNTAFDVAHIADNEGKNIDTVAKVYFNLNEIFSFVWLRDQARERQAESQWEAETLKNLTDRLYKTQATLTRYIVSNYCDTYKKTCDKNPVQTWLKAHENATQPIIDMLGHLREHDAPDFAMLTATELRLSQLI